MGNAKVQISKEELELVMDRDIILTKNRIIQKVYELFGLIAENYSLLSVHSVPIPSEAKLLAPKISKGENYRGLPYVILDYPKSFSREDIFAIRTMFWWGNSFSITLHLRGVYKTLFEGRLAIAPGPSEGINWWLQLSEDEWQHHWEEGTHLEISKIGPLDWNRLIQERKFLKISAFIPLEFWNSADMILLNYYKALIKQLET